MAINQYFGGGTLLQFGGLTAPSSTSAYATLAGITDVIKGASTTKVIDITTHDATNIDTNPTIRKAGGLIDEGKYTFKMYSDLGDTAGQIALFNARHKTGYFRLLPVGYSPQKSVTFQAVIADISDSYPLADYQMWDVTLDVSGPKVIA